MFSERSGRSAPPNRWTRLRDEKEAAGARLLDLTESNPTAVDIDYPRDEIRASLADPRALRYEPDPRGLQGAREAVAAQYAAAGHAVDPERILLTASTSEAYGFLFKLLTDPGDAVRVPRPGYPLFEVLGRLEAVVESPYGLDPEDGWSLDVRRLAEGAPPARAVIVVNPNNPTGTFLKRAEWAALQGACARHGWAVIADEVFADYARGPDPNRVECAAAAADVLTFSLGGLSKSVGLPQLKLGWVVVGGPVGPARAACERLEWIADAYLSVGAPVQWGAARLLELGRRIRERIRARLDANRRLLEARLAGSPAAALPSEGGWYAVLQVPATLGEEEWAVRLLDRDDLLVHPGYFYEFPREAFLVVSLLPPEERFRDGIDRLRARITADA